MQFQQNGVEGWVLVVDDKPMNCELVDEVLTDRGFNVVCVNDGPTALEVIDQHPFDVVLLDVSMPGMDGLEVCHRLKQNPLTSAIPIVFLTAHKGEALVVRALEAGGNDFLEKPYLPSILVARLRCQVAIHRAHQALLKLATRDALTGLMNRRAGHEYLERQLQLAADDPQHDFSLLMIDVDHFKTINDRLGHAAGDDALVDIAHALDATVGSLGEVIRFGGEEFLAVLPHAPLGDALMVAERVCDAVRNLHCEAPLSVSVGASSLQRIGPEDAHRGRLDALLASADRALYRAKNAGRDQVQECSIVPPPVVFRTEHG